MNCLDSLDISAGVTSVTGSGGKTSLLRSLSQEIVSQKLGTVILATTTHFLPFEGVALVASSDEAELEAALCAHGIVCVGTPVGSVGHVPSSRRDDSEPSRAAGDETHTRWAAAPGIVDGATTQKLGPSPIPVARLARIADYVLVEADGSRRLPLKAHAAHEPAIPRGSNKNLLVVGASGLARPVYEAVHRPKIFCDRAECKPSDDATPKLVARCLAAEATLGITHPNSIVINQAETLRRMSMASDLACELSAAGLDVEVFAGSIRDHRLSRIPA